MVSCWKYDPYSKRNISGCFVQRSVFRNKFYENVLLVFCKRLKVRHTEFKENALEEMEYVKTKIEQCIGCRSERPVVSKIDTFGL